MKGPPGFPVALKREIWLRGRAKARGPFAAGPRERDGEHPTELTAGWAARPGLTLVQKASRAQGAVPPKRTNWGAARISRDLGPCPRTLTLFERSSGDSEQASHFMGRSRGISMQRFSEKTVLRTIEGRPGCQAGAGW